MGLPSCFPVRSVRLAPPLPLGQSLFGRTLRAIGSAIAPWAIATSQL
ncbi:hypothetical protein [Mastigocladopsis repens]|nr:hypothetical protein [Mastigocladopsis repens]